MKYQQKISERSNNNITIIKYYGAKEKLTAKCNNCGYEWKIRADHLLERPYCTKCKNR